MPKTKYEISTGNELCNDDTNLEMKSISETKPENVLPSELTADQVDRGGGSGRLVSFQTLSNLPNIIFLIRRKVSANSRSYFFLLSSFFF